MKKALPYLVIGVVLAVLVALLVVSAAKPQRRLNPRVTLRQSDKIPYGTSAARTLLPHLFPAAAVSFDRRHPGTWDSIDGGADKQAVFIVADHFDADEEELDDLARFVNNGNAVFLIHRSASEAAADYFGITLNNAYPDADEGPGNDSLLLQLTAPAFTDRTVYSYPGRRYDNGFYQTNTSYTTVLGRSGNGLPNFIQLNYGRGAFYLHSAPLAFSNYFLLHKGNAAYFEQAVSVLPAGTRRIVWNEYFLERPRNQSEDPNWLRTLFRYPAFKWGLLTAAATLALYVLLGMRRRQRMIPPYATPVNDSLDFVKTLGRLYYDRRDHHNLASKMAAYFLEQVRSRYKLSTHTLDEDFAQALHQKSGYGLPETKTLVNTIAYLGTVNFIPEQELVTFYRQLERFYQNT